MSKTITLGPLEVYENDDGTVGFVDPSQNVAPNTPLGGSFNPNVTLAFLESLTGVGSAQAQDGGGLPPPIPTKPI